MNTKIIILYLQPNSEALDANEICNFLFWMFHSGRSNIWIFTRFFFFFETFTVAELVITTRSPKRFSSLKIRLHEFLGEHENKTRHRKWSRFSFFFFYLHSQIRFDWWKRTRELDKYLISFFSSFFKVENVFDYRVVCPFGAVELDLLVFNSG